jgi:peptidoglycan/xylan/chitin deacetylase (PgdA/CDA1 family)
MMGPGRDYIGYGRTPPKVVWPDGAHVAVQLAVNYEEGSDYSFTAGDGRNESALGEISYSMDPAYRDLAIESVYEYGSRVGNWRLMNLFDEYDIKVTYFAAAVALEANPEVGRWIGESGHEGACHGWRWQESWLVDPEVEREHIHRAVESIARTCGERPLGWYDRYCASIHTRELLVEEGGFLYDSNAYNDDLPYFVEARGRSHLVVPYTATYNDARFVAPQGFSSPQDFFETCRRGLDELWREGAHGFPKMMSIGLHPRVAGQAARTSALREFIEYALEKGQVWFARRVDMARWWLEHHHEFDL